MSYKTKTLYKEDLDKIKELLNSFMVSEYHKTLLKGILSNNEHKNVSKADKEILQDLFRRYGVN